jgi:hypothetical protein
VSQWHILLKKLRLHLSFSQGMAIDWRSCGSAPPFQCKRPKIVPHKTLRKVHRYFTRATRYYLLHIANWCFSYCKKEQQQLAEPCNNVLLHKVQRYIIYIIAKDLNAYQMIFLVPTWYSIANPQLLHSSTCNLNTQRTKVERERERERERESMHSVQTYPFPD